MINFHYNTEVKYKMMLRFNDREVEYAVDEAMSNFSISEYYNNETSPSCTNLTSVTIPEGVVKIPYRAFSDCTSLTSVTIPEGVAEIGIGAFLNCSSLTNISFPSSMEEIASLAFRGCSSLKTVNFFPSSKIRVSSLAFD